MDAERWRQVKRILEEARVLSPAERDEYLVKVCGSDAGLRKEVESLIAHGEQEEGFLDRYPVGRGEGRAMTLGPDARLGPYRIESSLGAGGMGEVYLAEDTKLGRKVALKVLSPELAESEERRARFKREAKVLAALDHPNIVQVFSVEEAEGTHFITMQLVRGKTLTELLPKNGFPLNKFFDIAIPLADAVAAAHHERITHRDLKPDNMMVGDDGRIKVLDFGLAKPTSGSAGGDADSTLPMAAKTAEGVIVGTLNYMSPEQAQGKAVDARSDIFSLGVVFYEMLTGRRPFGVKDVPLPLAERSPAGGGRGGS